MKFFRIITALTLCAAMLLSITSCGNADKELFVGSWEAEFDISEFVNEATKENMSDYSDYFMIDEMILVLKVTYNADGTYDMSIDREKFREACDDLLPDFIKAVEEMYKEFAKDMEMPVDELLELAGKTYEEIAETMISGMDTDAVADELQKSGRFRASGGKLYRSNAQDEKINKKQYETYEFTDDGALKITGYEGDGTEGNPFKYPLVFKKIG